MQKVGSYKGQNTKEKEGHKREKSKVHYWTEVERNNDRPGKKSKIERGVARGQERGQKTKET